jgi:hypothetical protein
MLCKRGKEQSYEKFRRNPLISSTSCSTCRITLCSEGLLTPAAISSATGEGLNLDRLFPLSDHPISGYYATADLLEENFDYGSKNQGC